MQTIGKCRKSPVKEPPKKLATWISKIRQCLQVASQIEIWLLIFCLSRPKPSWQNSGRQNRHCSTLRATQRGHVEVISSQHAQHAKVLNCHDWPISVAWGQTIPAHSDYERLHRRRCNPSSNGGFFRFKRLGQPGRPSRRAWRRTACCLTPKILRSRHGEYPITRRRKAGTNRFWKITAALAWSAILSFLQR